MKVRNVDDISHRIVKDGIFFIIPNNGKVYEVPDNFYDCCQGLMHIVVPPKPVEIKPPEPPKQVLEEVKIYPAYLRNETKYKPTFRPERRKYAGKKYTYYLKDPNGVEYNDIEDIKEFCKEHNVPRTNIMRMAQLNATYSKWSGYRKETECVRETNRDIEKRELQKKKLQEEIDNTPLD